MIQFASISETDRDNILDRGIGPGITVDEIEPSRRGDLQDICETLRTCLKLHWTVGYSGEDCFVHDGDGCYRMLCVEISSEKILNSEFLEYAVAAVNKLPEGVWVDFCNAWGILKINSEDLFPDFNIFISRTQVLIFSTDDAIKRRLGIAV